MKPTMLAVAVCWSALALLSKSSLAREQIALADGWKFLRADAPLDAAVTTWENVTVPHTWNAFDGQNGKAANPDLPDGYYRGPGWYARDLDVPAAWRGRRVFLYCEAASLVADVYLNGENMGQHRGGFAAFCFELTSRLRFGERNTLRVRVDNSRFDDVPPLSGDFTVEGGLYRPVHLLVTDPVCITPLDHASSGVYLTQQRVTADEAVVEVETKLSNASPESAACRVEISLRDATGREVGATAAAKVVPPGETAPARATLTIPHPHRWNGRRDPYLYRVQVDLVRDGTLVDHVDEPLGLRTVAIDPGRGFLLNGEPYALHGVNRHQELADKGWALSDEDHAADIAMIVDLGATSLRLAHYQQSHVVHDLCDRAGLVVWQEIPIVERVNDTAAFNANARQQLTEMILQGYNHPSLAMWGLYNELRATWIKGPWSEPEPLLRDLQQLAKQLDPSRPTVGASWSPDPLPMHPIPDNQAFNIYPGWYFGTVDDFAATIDKASAGLGGRNIALSEYGAGANIAHHEEGEPHQPAPGGPFHPEEWQTLVHEHEWAMARNNPHLWGTFLWVMFDFASDARDEGQTPGINDKGLVTHDRRVKKDAFYFYQASWSDRPMVHIAGRRLTPRHQSNTEIKVYSNCDQVELRVNGTPLAPATPDDVRIFRWPGVTLQPGANHIDVTARAGDTVVTDACDWMLAAGQEEH